MPYLDYDPGPGTASYSRVGPPARPDQAARETDPVASAHHRFRHEMAGELGARRTGARRFSRRKFKPEL